MDRFVGQSDGRKDLPLYRRTAVPPYRRTAGAVWWAGGTAGAVWLGRGYRPYSGGAPNQVVDRFPLYPR